MKELDVFRYLKKYRGLIAGLSVLAGVAFFLIAQLYIQQYTAVTVIEYTGQRAAEGRSLDGTPIDNHRDLRHQPCGPGHEGAGHRLHRGHHG